MIVLLVISLAAIIISVIVLIKKHDDDDSRSKFSNYAFVLVIAPLLYMIFGAIVAACVCVVFAAIISLISVIIEDELKALYCIVAVFAVLIIALVYTYAWHVKV